MNIKLVMIIIKFVVNIINHIINIVITVPRGRGRGPHVRLHTGEPCDMLRNHISTLKDNTRELAHYRWVLLQC